MLRLIKVRNLAIIPEVEVQFENGFNVLTGETGAGKSILIDAISLLAGARASAEIVRSGETMATLEGTLRLPPSSPIWMKLEELGIPRDGDEVFLRRAISSDGRSRAFVNDTSTSVGVLNDLAPHWLDVSGQHSNQLMLSEEFHLSLLDEYLGSEPLLTEYGALFQEVRTIYEKLESFRRKREEAKTQKEFLSFQYQELEKANLRSDEIEELESRHKRIANVQSLAALADEMERKLAGEAGGEEVIGEALSSFRNLVRLDPSVKNWEKSFQSVLSELEELTSALSKYRSQLDVDPQDVDVINERLSKLQNISRKYGSVEKAINERDRIKEMLSLIEDSSLDEKEMEEVLKAKSSVLEAKAKELSLKRKKGGEKFSKEVSHELKQLGMPNARIEVQFLPVQTESSIEISRNRYGASGAETVRFQFAPNQGEGFLPLNKVASGGELSRVLLAVKGVALLRSNRHSPTYLFDEIDAGIGGDTAERVGIRLKSLAEARQVLCVTHLAQVASYASHHLHVEKVQRSGRTVALVKELKDSDKVTELARMMGGIEVTSKTKAVAAELLDHANQKKTRRVLTVE